MSSLDQNTTTRLYNVHSGTCSLDTSYVSQDFCHSCSLQACRTGVHFKSCFTGLLATQRTQKRVEVSDVVVHESQERRVGCRELLKQRSDHRRVLLHRCTYFNNSTTKTNSNSNTTITIPTNTLTVVNQFFRLEYYYQTITSIVPLVVDTSYVSQDFAIPAACKYVELGHYTSNPFFVRTSSHLAHAETCGSLRRCRSRVLGASGWLSRAPEAAERPSAGSADICVTQILFLEICGRLFYIQEPILILYI